MSRLKERCQSKGAACAGVIQHKKHHTLPCSLLQQCIMTLKDKQHVQTRCLFQMLPNL